MRINRNHLNPRQVEQNVLLLVVELRLRLSELLSMSAALHAAGVTWHLQMVRLPLLSLKSLEPRHLSKNTT